MNTLKNISSEIIRQNWLNYKDEIYNSPYYELLWDSLESKFEIDKNYIQKFVKISMYLKTKKSNTQKIFDSIKDTKNDTELNELAEEESPAV